MAQISNQGVSIHYKVEGKGSPVVLLHGAFDSCEGWIDYGYVARLRRDYQLILIDLRGHGQSDKPHDPDSYSVDLFVQDVIAVLDELGVGICHTLGYSLGGWIVYSLLRKYPERIQSMILLDGVTGPDDSKVIRELANNMEELIPLLLQNATPTHKARLLNNDKLALLSLSSGVADDIPRIIDDINKLPETINLASLILTSDLGGVEMELMRKIERAVSNASLITLAGLSHFDLFVRSDLTIPYILRFLDAQAR